MPRRAMCGTVGAGNAALALHLWDAEHIERQPPYIDRSDRNEYRVGNADISMKTQLIYCCALDMALRCRVGESYKEGNSVKIQFDTTLERDIDLLVMEEFISDKDFAEIFLNAVGITASYTIAAVIHSKTDAELGESDIVFVLELNGKRHALHIEDKIDAIAMPRQRDRYDLRAQKDIEKGQYESYSVLIVAPSKYLAVNSEAQKYEHQVTYEQMRDHFAAKADERSKYKLALIERAIIDQKNGYQYVANPGVVRFCTAMAAYQKEKYPGLPGGSTAWWPEYPTLLNDTKIVFKANKGFCDLQFGHALAPKLYLRVKSYLSERMRVVQAGKSASVRIVASPIWFENAFEENLGQVDEALAAINELYELSQKLVEADV